MVDISIVVPIYNVEKWLHECLHSLVNQTLSSIEIICVDDGSTDGSAAIVGQYMELDPRIKLIQQKNSGSAIARKRAVENATGKYFLFVDPDDYLALNACEKLLHEMKSRNCDILQYGVEIHEMTIRTEAQRKKSAGYFNPAPCMFEGADILRACYLRTEIAFNVIFRCFDGDLVRKAFAHIPDVYSINETDVFAFFFLAYYARKFVSIPDRYYHYRYGIGVSTKKTYDISEFRRVLCKFDTLRVLQKFAEHQGHGDKNVTNAVLEVEKRMVGNTFGAVFGRMNSQSDTIEAFKMARERAGALNCIKWLADKYAGKQDDCAEMLVRNGFAERCCAHGKIKHIGLFYYHLSCGGIQRVVQQEINVLLNQGYRITLFLEEEITETCYPIPSNVDVVYLPRTTGTNRAPVSMRCERLSEALAARDIDIFYSHAHVATTMLWDMLVCKWQHQIPFVLHYHNLFALTLYFGIIPTQFPAIIKILKCADRVIALSRVDEIFFNANDIPSAYLQNPVDSALVKLWNESDFGHKDSNIVLWVGRMSWEKKPAEAIRIFIELHKRNPAARLVMVGGGRPEILENIKTLIEENSLQDVVSIEGEQLNTYPYYRKASVFLSTSLFEGFQLTALEALCAGVPIVAYSIPHLDLYRDNPAVIQIPQGDVRSAADALDKLLQSTEINAFRSKAKEFVRSFCMYDFAAELKKLICGLAETPLEPNPSAPSFVPIRDFALCSNMLVTGIASACGRGTRRINELNSKLAELQKKISNETEKFNKSEKECAQIKSELTKVKAELQKKISNETAKFSKSARDAAQIRSELTKVKTELLKERSAIATAKRLSNVQQREIASLKQSESYRLGLMLTFPLRKLWRIYKSCVHRTK